MSPRPLPPHPLTPLFKWPVPRDAPRLAVQLLPPLPRRLPPRLVYPPRYLGTFVLSAPLRRRRRRRPPLSRRRWGFGRTWCPLPRRVTQSLQRTLMRATVVYQLRPETERLCRGPELGLRPLPAPRRRFRARRKVGGGCPTPRPPRRPRLRFLGRLVWRRSTLWGRLAAATQRQIGALRARTPRPPACGDLPRPRLGPGLRGGLTPPSSVPSLLPQSMTPPLRGSVTPLRVLEVWQRAWIVGLLLRPRSWATRLRF
jgi:hypothetical protein